MDDFVSRVVGQVLGNVSIAEKMPARPNYQREKSKRRLITREMPPLPLVASDNQDISQSLTDCFAPVRCAALKGLQIASCSAQTDAASNVSDDFFEDKHSGITIRILNQVDKRITEMVGIRYRVGEAIGIISHKKSSVSYLLAIDELLQKFSPSDSVLTWNLETNSTLVFCFSGTMEMVRKALQDFKNNINSKYQRGLVCIQPSPSIFLQRYLKVNGRYPIAVCEDVNTVDALFGINEYYHRQKDSMVVFKIQGEAVIAQGEAKAMVAAMEDIHSLMISV